MNQISAENYQRSEKPAIPDPPDFEREKAEL
jgi:hypothetical protein